MAASDLISIEELDALENRPKPTNSNLKKLFKGVNRIVFKKGGVSNELAMTNDIVLAISEKESVQKLKSLLKIDESNTIFFCLCSGSYAIELYANSKLKTTIGFHHGVSIRYNRWNSDAELTDSENLLFLLAELGLTKPLNDRIEEKKREEVGNLKYNKWIEISPKSFLKYLNRIDMTIEYPLKQLIDELSDEIPDKQKQIIALLQSYGYSENLWNGYPIYEELPNEILAYFDVNEIIEAYLNSNRNYKTRKGLGRFLCFFEFKKIRKKYLKFITDEVITDLEKCFDSIGEKQGIKEILKLKNEKSRN
jgi:hypothetical protein